MAEYRDVEPLRKQIVEFKTAVKKLAKSISFLMAYISGIDAVMEEIDKQPTADVQEVKRGYWKFNQHSKVVASFICSECQTRFYNFGNSKILSPTPYCPNCGARMDGVANG